VTDNERTPLARMLPKVIGAGAFMGGILAPRCVDRHLGYANVTV